MADSCKEGFVLPKGLKVNKLSFMVKHETEQTKSERGRCLRKLIPWSLSKLFFTKKQQQQAIILIYYYYIFCVAIQCLYYDLYIFDQKDFENNLL